MFIATYKGWKLGISYISENPIHPVYRLPIRDGNDTALYPLRGDGTVYRLPIRDRAPPRIGLTTSAIMYRLFLEDKIRSFRRHFMMPVIQS